MRDMIDADGNPMKPRNYGHSWDESDDYEYRDRPRTRINRFGYEEIIPEDEE